MLRLRPDIRSAERKLAAATATQGAAFAELFPKISVAAFMGVQNSDLENLFRSSAFSWASGSAIMQPIFNFGRIRAGIDLADARQQEAYYNYEQTVLEALKESETSLKLLVKEEERRQRLEVSVQNLKEAHRLGELRYREGISTFLDVLETERALYVEEMNLAQSRAQTTLYLISFFKAIGGAGSFKFEQPEDPLRPWG
jgi:outer membrane protein TolC